MQRKVLEETKRHFLNKKIAIKNFKKQKKIGWIGEATRTKVVFKKSKTKDSTRRLMKRFRKTKKDSWTTINKKVDKKFWKKTKGRTLKKIIEIEISKEQKKFWKIWKKAIGRKKSNKQI